MNNNESFELEEMRQQMALLKKKLEKQEIINERMASKAKASLEKKVGLLNQGFKGGWILARLMIPLGYYEVVGKLGFSLAFFILFFTLSSKLFFIFFYLLNYAPIKSSIESLYFLEALTSFPPFPIYVLSAGVVSIVTIAFFQSDVFPW